MAINLGIIGTGLAVRNLHWPVLRKMREEFRVVGLANRSRARAESLAADLGGPKVYDDYKSLLEDKSVEAVLITVPIELNAAVLLDAIAAGKHILAEKPIAATPAEARDVLRANTGRSQVIAIAENFRYREDVVKAREIIRSSEIGEVYAFQISARFDMNRSFRRSSFEKGTWRHSPLHLGTGILTDCGVHAISSLRDILGEVTELYAQMLDTSAACQGPDTLLAQLTMANKAVGHYLACYSAKLVKESVFDLAAYGTNGSLQLTEGEVTWTTGSSEQASIYHPLGYDRGYSRQWQNFYRAIRGEEDLVSTPREAYRDLLVIDAALRSASWGAKLL